MSNYNTIEVSIKNSIENNMTYFNDEDIVKQGAIDIAYRNAIDKYPSDPRFCVLVHRGGRLDRTGVGLNSTLTWLHRIRVDFYIPVLDSYSLEQVDEKLREVYDDFLTLMSDKKCMLGPAKRFLIIDAEPPDPVALSDRNYLMLSFNTETLEQLG